MHGSDPVHLRGMITVQIRAEQRTQIGGLLGPKAFDPIGVRQQMGDLVLGPEPVIETFNQAGPGGPGAVRRNGQKDPVGRGQADGGATFGDDFV